MSKGIGVVGMLFFLILSAVKCLGRDYPQIRSITEKQERINGQLFLHRAKIIQGCITEMWLIDGVDVDFAAFEEQYIKAVAEEARQELQQERAQQEKNAQYIQETSRAIYRRLLAEVCSAGKALCKKYRTVALEPFFVYEEATFSDNASFIEAQDVFLLNQYEEPSDYREILADCEAKLARIKLFFEQAISRAISSCTDTKVLKDILALL